MTLKIVSETKEQYLDVCEIEILKDTLKFRRAETSDWEELARFEFLKSVHVNGEKIYPKKVRLTDEV